MNKYFQNIKKWKWGRIILLIITAVLVIVFIECPTLLNYASNWFKSIAEMPNLFYLIMGLAIVTSGFHFYFAPKGGIAKEHLLYKRLGPILSVPMTCATHGIFIYSGILLIYLICYDNNTLKRYGSLDKTTVTITMLAIITYAFYSLGLIIGDICNPKEEKNEGRRIEEPINN